MKTQRQKRHRKTRGKEENSWKEKDMKIVNNAKHSCEVPSNTKMNARATQQIHLTALTFISLDRYLFAQEACFQGHQVHVAPLALNQRQAVMWRVGDRRWQARHPDDMFQRGTRCHSDNRRPQISFNVCTRSNIPTFFWFCEVVRPSSLMIQPRRLASSAGRQSRSKGFPFSRRIVKLQWPPTLALSPHPSLAVKHDGHLPNVTRSLAYSDNATCSRWKPSWTIAGCENMPGAADTALRALMTNSATTSSRVLLWQKLKHLHHFFLDQRLKKNSLWTASAATRSWMRFPLSSKAPGNP